ncbi:hypothetical protein BEL04_22740 [Mucilaginibacter sp. PPCGB 2223]|uniref:terminase small subunit n=1 Tax=Mucilaginibacter sp. PPCGB 2223 TaxID=1886027 RepID=UPI000824C16D|nr:terminase small subunit [Mucilaginibacter sp. PPCGB 2223]OCX50595.1 hypothetical protein BEL04_22740 [Mucilaginibacter sp. PPCGB 2223]
MENTTTGLLTPKQQKFCDEYLIDMNATRAALRAGYSSSTALSGALMRIPKIAYYLQERTNAAARQAQVTHQMILTELSKIAFGNMRNYYRSDGTLKGVHELADDEGAALWSMRITETAEGKTTFIRLNSKLGALEKMAKHLRFYTEPEEAPKNVVYVDTARLTEEDKFEDDSFDEPEEDDDYKDEYDEFEDEKERERIWRMESERNSLVYFYPKLEKILPPAKFMTDEMIVHCLKQLTAKRADEPGWITQRRSGTDEHQPVFDPDAPRLFERDEEEAGSESTEDAAAGVSQAGAPGQLGGTIDFGSAKKGTCRVPLMMGNSREYRSW